MHRYVPPFDSTRATGMILPMLSPRLLFAFFSLLAFTAPMVAFAQAGTEEEARRQLEFAQGEIDAENFQKALTSAESALRLHPPLYEAMAYKALALEGLGDLKIAESLLITYRELRGGWENLPKAEGDLERVQGKIGDRIQRLERMAALPPFDDVRELDDMPAFPDGSEEFLQWLVLRQQLDAAKARMEVGGGLLGGGIALLVGGGVALAVTSTLSKDDPNNANIEAFYAGGVGGLFSGATLTLVGLPLMVSGGARVARLKKGGVAGAQARLEATRHGLALRF